jgi:hypothetical protein
MITKRFAERAPRAGVPGARTKRGRRIVGEVTAVAVLLAGPAVLMVAGTGTASASTLNGVATTATPSNDAFLASGGSDTEYTVTLPADSDCTGDTAHDGYHVWSYLVQPSVNISSLTFTDGEPSQGLGLFDSTGTYYGPADTADTTGEVIDIPNNLEWGPVVSSNSLLSTLLYQDSGTSGLWEGGIACANTSGALTDNWNFQITFTKSTSDPNGFTWSVVPGPAGDTFARVTSADSTTFTEGTAGSFTPTATGTPAPTITQSGTLPAGVTFTGGKLTGTPTATGTFPITFTATNGIGNPATQSFTLTVQAAAGFHITTTSLPSATFDKKYSTTLKATGGPTPYTWTEKGLPSGLTLSKTKGVISGEVKKASEEKSYTVKVTATDKTKGTATKSLTLDVVS